MKYIWQILVIVVMATLGALLKDMVSSEHWYIIGWVFGSFSLAICNTIDSIYRYK